MKVLLINPPKRHQVWAGVPDIFNDRHAYLFPPLGALYLASYLKKHTRHEVQVLDTLPEALGDPEIAARIRRFGPDLVGILTLSHNLVNVARLAELVKRVDPRIHVMLGGPHATAFPTEALALPCVDSICRGDGEETLVEWLEALQAGSGFDKVAGVSYKERGESHVNPDRPILKDLDSLPFPDRAGVDIRRYFTPGMKKAVTTTVLSSRGCPYQCDFCSVPKGYRGRSAANIADELEECIDRYGIQEIHFIDDLFNLNSRRVIDISTEISDRKLDINWGFKGSIANTTPEMLAAARAAGCVRAHYGVETFTDEGLKSIGKRATVEQIHQVFQWTREAGITAVAYMIVGCPHERTREEILKVRQFLKKLKPDYVVFSLYTPYPDAPIFRRGVELGLWPEDVWQKFMYHPVEDYDLPTVWNQYLSKDELLDLFKMVHRDFYYDPRVILRTLLSVENLVDLKRLAKGGWQLLRMELLRPHARRI